ncbi:MAG: isochorismatase family cysteine hydrolase [Burkholderiaceae bacterium]
MNRIAYLAMHYQNENCHPDGKIPYGLEQDALVWREQVLAAARQLAAGLRAHQVPILHVRLATQPGQDDVICNAPIFSVFKERGAWPTGSWGADFVEGLGAQPGDFDITHGRNSAFYGSRLEEHMARLRPDWLIVSGVSTAYAVETTVRDAADIGYQVVVAHDACATFRRDFHEASLRAMSLLARVASVGEILAALSSPEGLAGLPFELRECRVDADP